MTKKSKTISCAFYDELVLHARRQTKFQFEDSEDEIWIADIFTRDKIEYALLSNGQVFDLTQIMIKENNLIILPENFKT